MPRLFTRKFAFWVTVAGVSVLANFGVELAAALAPSPGFKRFVEFVHKGPGGSA